MGSIADKIIRFYNALKFDDNHRYKSWEHCYQYFGRKKIDPDIGCLQLAFYLASWGMYRGSSFLLWKDYKIHMGVVKYLLHHLNLRHLRFSQGDVDLNEVYNLVEYIKEWYPKNIDTVNGDKKEIKVSDTLATKILLGVLGCVPAYDRYFIDGLHEEGVNPYSLKKGLPAVIQYYEENIVEFTKAQLEIKRMSRIKYPAMKLVDMYFWQIGYESDPNIKDKIYG